MGGPSICGVSGWLFPALAVGSLGGGFVVSVLWGHTRALCLVLRTSPALSITLLPPPLCCLKLLTGEVYSLCLILCLLCLECPSPFFSWPLTLQDSPHFLPDTLAGPSFSKMCSDPYLLTFGTLLFFLSVLAPSGS